ncbi:MAG TPA: efflux RND transporter periplasmic adaptor subunit, partial [Acidobacteriota bacterium]
MNRKRIIFLATILISAAAIAFFFFVTRNDAQPQKKQASADHQQHAPAQKKEPKILYWVDPMHPSYKSDKPGIAPDCGMQLTPVYADEEETSSNSIPGTVKLTGRKQQLINLKVVEVSDQHVMKNIRTVGALQYDETTIAKIHSKIEGWIEKVYVDYTGRLVRKGQPLFSIYSPELVATQQEYLLALKADRTLKESEFADVSSGANALRESAYRRLRLWDVSDQQIKKLEQT